MSATISSMQGSMKHAPLIETDFTGAFVRYAAPQLHGALKAQLSKHKISAQTQAVYIHQSPMVEIDVKPPTGRTMGTQKCEIGDVLVVMSVRRGPRKTYWRAVLMQLKMDSGTTQQAKDPQFWLYEKWPLFHIYRGGLQNHSRDFNNDSRAGQFALVSNSLWEVLPPAARISAGSTNSVEAGRFLIEMLYATDPKQRRRNGHCGRRVFTRPYPTAPLSWSQTVWDILNVTGTKHFNARSLFDNPQSRMAFLYSSDADEFLPSNGVIIPPGELASERMEGAGRGFAVLRVGVDASGYNPDEDADFE